MIESDRAIVDRRMAALRLPLTGPRFETPEEVVRWLVVVQSQDYGPAKWSVAQRMAGTTDADVDAAYQDGRVLRTHLMRPTWHFVLPEDIRSLLLLTGPRIQALSAYMYRTTGLDESVRGRSNEVIARALDGGRHLTRTQIRADLDAAGFDTSSFRMGYLMMHAEVTGLVCSGRMQGKQHTYALLDERAPAATIDRDEALADLVRRYFTSHGPATVKDFRTWCSLSAADANQGLTLAGSSLERESFRGLTWWFGAGSSGEVVKDPSPTVHLLQPYDEYIMGYSETKLLLDLHGAAGWSPTDRAVYNGAIMLDGQVAGHWKRTIGRDDVVIDVELIRPFGDRERQALQAAADRHAAFLERRAVVVVAEIA